MSQYLEFDYLCIVISVLLGPKSLREDWDEKVQDERLDSHSCSLEKEVSFPCVSYLNTSRKPLMQPSFCVQFGVQGGQTPSSSPPSQEKPKCYAHLTVPLALSSVEKSQEHTRDREKTPLLLGQLMLGLVSTRTEKLAAQIISHFYSLDTIIDPH